MGQKVNPHGLRVGVIKDWDSRWFTSKREFGDTLVEDYKIRKVLKKQLYNAGVPKIEIERTIDNATSKPRIRVTIHCAKPGMVIGRQGAEKEKIQAQLSKMTGKDVLVNIVEVNNMSTNAQLVAEDIASQLERRIAFRRATKMAMRNAMSPRRGSGAVAAKGIKIQIGGRLTAPTSPAARAITRAPFPCRRCARTSITALPRRTPPTARSASRFGSIRAKC